jgi:hypothetical protein
MKKEPKRQITEYPSFTVGCEQCAYRYYSECRKNPPQIIILEIGYKTCWPHVTKKDWCFSCKWIQPEFRTPFSK